MLISALGGCHLRVTEDKKAAEASVQSVLSNCCLVPLLRQKLYRKTCCYLEHALSPYTVAFEINILNNPLRKLKKSFLPQFLRLTLQQSSGLVQIAYENITAHC